MEFSEKLQQLRKKNGLTQEELAARLFVSRTAISKWESGRGYPSIESLKAIAGFFSVSIDQLLSPGEILTIAEEDERRNAAHSRDLTYGLLDICISLLLFLPFFGERKDGILQSVSLIALDGVQPYVKIAYAAAVILLAVLGILTLALQNCHASVWAKAKITLSITLGTAAVLLFIISSQPYAAVFSLVLLAIKAVILIKRG